MSCISVTIYFYVYLVGTRQDIWRTFGDSFGSLARGLGATGHSSCLWRLVRLPGSGAGHQKHLGVPRAACLAGREKQLDHRHDTLAT
jgi:hypothetical protein